jgi:hypothetical protein
MTELADAGRIAGTYLLEAELIARSRGLTGEDSAEVAAAALLSIAASMVRVAGAPALPRTPQLDAALIERVAALEALVAALTECVDVLEARP